LMHPPGPACPACGLGNLTHGLDKGRYTYLVCDSCASATLELGWSDAVYEVGYFARGESYGYFDYEADRLRHLETAHRRLVTAADVTPRLTRLVDVGAALGFTLEAARDKGLEGVAVEISEHATQRLRAAGFEVHRSLEELPGNSFDAVLFGQVLEHMPDPASAVDHTYRILRPGGVIFIETWDGSSATARGLGSRWQQIAPPSVVHLFSSAGIRKMLERHGFEDIEIRPWRKRLSVGGYLGVVASKLPSWIRDPLMRLARLTRITRIPITYRFDDLIAVTARRPD
jgi:SAM-dependent methyltransferase